MVGRSHHDLYESEETHPTPFSILAGALGPRHLISTSGNNVRDVFISCSMIEHQFQQPSSDPYIQSILTTNDVRDVFIPCFMTEGQFQQPSIDPYIQSILTTNDVQDAFIPCFMTEDQFQQPSSDPYVQSILTTNNVRDVFIPCFMTEDHFQQPSSDPYIQSILTTPNAVRDTEDSFSAMTSFGVTRPQAPSMTLYPTQSFTLVPPLSTEVCGPPLTAHPVYHPPPICPTGCQLHHGSWNQASPHTHVHIASGQDGRPTINDSNYFQGFPSTQATLTSDPYYQGYPHIPPDTHNVPGQEGCQMYSGSFPPSTSTQIPTAVKPSMCRNCTVPCGWKDEHGHICGVDITHECQAHFATAHGITKLSARTQVTCRWCDKNMTRGCLVRHIREAHLRVGRLKSARTH